MGVSQFLYSRSNCIAHEHGVVNVGTDFFAISSSMLVFKQPVAPREKGIYWDAEIFWNKLKVLNFS